jgi:hypothetical protein
MAGGFHTRDGTDTGFDFLVKDQGDDGGTYTGRAGYSYRTAEIIYNRIIFRFNIYIFRRGIPVFVPVPIIIIGWSGSRFHASVIPNLGIYFVHDHQGINDTGHRCAGGTAGPDAQHQNLLRGQSANHNSLTPGLALGSQDTGFAAAFKCVGGYFRMGSGTRIDFISQHTGHHCSPHSGPPGNGSIGSYQVNIAGLVSHNTH